jgi:hypothetical protein
MWKQPWSSHVEDAGSQVMTFEPKQQSFPSRQLPSRWTQPQRPPAHRVPKQHSSSVVHSSPNDVQLHSPFTHGWPSQQSDASSHAACSAPHRTQPPLRHSAPSQHRRSTAGSHASPGSPQARSQVCSQPDEHSKPAQH